MSNSMNNLPTSIALSVAGLLATTAIVVGATVIRPTPLPDAEATLGATTKAPRAEPERPSKTSSDKPRDDDSDEQEPEPSSSAEATEARAKFVKEVDSGRYKTAVESLAALLEKDRGAPREKETRAAIVELSMRVMLLQGPEPEMVFGLICQRMGKTGIDILYELLTTRGGSRGAKRAEELLKDEKIRKKGSDAMRVAYDIRTARGCDDKKAFLYPARKYGDRRTLGQLYELNRTCGGRKGAGDPDIKEAIEDIKKRLGED